MNRVASVALAVGLYLAAFALAFAPGSAKSQDEGTKLLLTTDYLYERVAVTAKFRAGHRLLLNVTLNDKGGTGTLLIDPNKVGYNEFGDPISINQMGLGSVAVTLELSNPIAPKARPDDYHDAKGRKVYKVKGNDILGSVFLVVSPNKEAGPNRLILVKGSGDNEVFVFQLHDKEIAK